jgi:hypothetical protein
VVNALKAPVLLQPDKILASSSIHKCRAPRLKAVRGLQTGLHKPVANGCPSAIRLCNRQSLSFWLDLDRCINARLCNDGNLDCDGGYRRCFMGQIKSCDALFAVLEVIIRGELRTLKCIYRSTAPQAPGLGS